MSNQVVAGITNTAAMKITIISRLISSGIPGRDATAPETNRRESPGKNGEDYKSGFTKYDYKQYGIRPSVILLYE